MWRDFELARWGGDPTSCPRCRVLGRCALLPRPDGERRVWRCAACRGQFSVLTGTVLERSRLPLPVWAGLVADVVAGSVSARESARRLGTTRETARLLRTRLAAAGVRAGLDPAAAMARLLRLPSDDVVRVRRAAPARHEVREGPIADYG